MINPEFLLNEFLSVVEVKSFLSLAIAFVSGVFLCFTPCVYPLIPITFGIVSSASLGKKRRAFFLSIVYALGISAGYVLFGVLAALTGKVFGGFGAHPLTHLVLGNVFLFFGLAMFDVIRLPGIYVSKGETEKVSSRSIGSIFALGLASSLAISPCALPVLGVILTVVFTQRDVIFGGSLLLSYALGIGSVFVILGFLGAFFVNLPKPGKWMNIFKKALGVLFICIAEYFIMKAGGLFL